MLDDTASRGLCCIAVTIAMFGFKVATGLYAFYINIAERCFHNMSLCVAFHVEDEPVC